MTSEEITKELLIELGKLGFKDIQYSIFEICSIKPAAEEAAKRNIKVTTMMSKIIETSRKMGDNNIMIKQGDAFIISFYQEAGPENFKRFLLNLVANCDID